MDEDETLAKLGLYKEYYKNYKIYYLIDKDKSKVIIRCAGVDVRPGDLVVGDADGVCVIPKEYIEVVLEKAEEKLAYEEKRVALKNYALQLEKGGELPELAPKEVVEVRMRLKGKA